VTWFRDRLAAGAVWLGLFVVAWLLLGAGWLAFVLWPWPTVSFTALWVGFLAGALVFGDIRRAVSEPVFERKDLAVDTSMGMAFDCQVLEDRISGEHPVTDVAMYVQSDDETRPARAPVFAAGTPAGAVRL